MTRWTEADPAPEQPWRESSSPGIRRLALEATRAAIKAAQERGGGQKREEGQG